MASEVFVDSGGFFALANPRDQHHDAAKAKAEQASAAGSSFITTDYVIDETITLLQARNAGHVVLPWLDLVLVDPAILIVWMDRQRFADVRSFFAKHADKKWSFTDCFSFVVMRERGMAEALAHDRHFRQAGFTPLLGDE